MNILSFKRQAIPPTSARKSKPLRNAAVEHEQTEDGCTLLKVPLEVRGGIYRLLSAKLETPAYKEVQLEEVGSYVWSLCDGKHTCEAIAAKLKSKFKLTKPEAEASLMSFLSTLAKRRYIVFE